jgi:DNA (cytosine-5)-methyltransferase 1
VADPRAASLLVVLERLGELRPPFVALENVPGFQGSRAHERLLSVLVTGGYTVSECQLCPTELGVPNRRRRFYLVASRCGPLSGPKSPKNPDSPMVLREILDRDAGPAFRVPQAAIKRYDGALHVVDAADERAECSCFTSAYGRSFVRSGSYLDTPDGIRRFSPAEILRLLGFPDSFTLPPQLSPRRAWPLVGNSLAVHAVRAILEPVFERFRRG